MKPVHTKYHKEGTLSSAQQAWSSGISVVLVQLTTTPTPVLKVSLLTTPKSQKARNPKPDPTLRTPRVGLKADVLRADQRLLRFVVRRVGEPLREMQGLAGSSAKDSPSRRALEG